MHADFDCEAETYPEVASALVALKEALQEAFPPSVSKRAAGRDRQVGVSKDSGAKRVRNQVGMWMISH